MSTVASSVDHNRSLLHSSMDHSNCLSFNMSPALSSTATSADKPPIVTSNNNMNSKVNKRLDRVPDNLGPNGTTPSGKPRLFLCTVCARAFARHEHLKRHERSHTKEKPFSCGVCQRKFSRRDLLLRHAQKLHAGCDDAIKRLRRRSGRAKSTSQSNNGEDIRPLKKQRVNNSVALPFKVEPVNFLVNEPMDFGCSTKPQISGRRTSFSAASSQNYASVPPNLSHQFYSGAVEFSTPQLMPIDSFTDLNQNSFAWINDISPLSSLELLNDFPQDDSTSFKSSTSLSESISSNSKKRSLESLKETSKRKNSTPLPQGSNDIFGYSFYDDDYTSSNQHDHFNSMKLSYPKLPSSYLNEINTNSSPDTISSGYKFSDYDELLSELEIPNKEEKIMSTGYSFYDNNESMSSAIAPSFFDWNANYLNNDSDMRSDGTTHFSKALFTPKTCKIIENVLSKYPFHGVPNPKLPPARKLNNFCEAFKAKFLTHYPFIHESFLNENAMKSYTSIGNSDSSDEPASEICLPLFIATIGSLYSTEDPKDRNTSVILYEISRRCLHVYLDSKKKDSETERATTRNSPLWLVQSLVLSVLYGLFAEYNSSDLTIILRQVNALCTLIRISGLTSVQLSQGNIELSDSYFQEYILYQSKVRTVFTIFNISSILTCLYNHKPFISYREISCDLPDLESYWNCQSIEEFKVKCTLNGSQVYGLNLKKILNDLLMNNQITYKISEFGSLILMYCVLQYFYFTKNSISNYSAGISPTLASSSDLIKNYRWESLLIVEDETLNFQSIMLMNIAVIRSLMIDLSKLKEFMWLKKWNELSIEFLKLNIKNDDLIDACDYSVRTLALLFLNDANSSNFSKCFSLTSQCLFFNIFYIAKFLFNFESRLSKNTNSKKPQEVKAIGKHFAVYLKVAKFLADLEKIMFKNFNYNDIESKLISKEFDVNNYKFNEVPSLAVENDSNTKDWNPDQVRKIASLGLSSNILKIGEFMFSYIYEKEMRFDIFKSLSEGLFHMRVFLESFFQRSLNV